MTNVGYTIDARITPKTAVKLLIANEMDLDAPLTEQQASAILHELSRASVEDLLKVIDIIEPLEQMDSGTLPQFGSLETLLRVPEIIVSLGFDSLSYTQLGFYLKGDIHAKQAANAKYGETHAKGACMLGYASFKQGRLTTSAFTDAICALEDQELRHRITTLLCLRIPMIQTLLCRAKDGQVNGYEPMASLKPSTQKRRSSCIRMILKELEHLKNDQLSLRIKNILWERNEEAYTC